MAGNSPTVAGIDVGGPKKGFHAVMLTSGRVVATCASTDAAAVAKWCADQGARIVGVDAPCGWSKDGGSRACERALARKQIHSFSTPTRERAEANPFYAWVQNGACLYAALKKSSYSLFADTGASPPFCFETFPHAIVCAFAGQVVPAKPKAKCRRKTLQDVGIDTAMLTNIDFIDAALCAAAARAFLSGSTALYGDAGEGIIVVPGSLK